MTNVTRPLRPGYHMTGFQPVKNPCFGGHIKIRPVPWRPLRPPNNYSFLTAGP
jgi:hypothetical protein